MRPMQFVWDAAYLAGRAIAEVIYLVRVARSLHRDGIGYWDDENWSDDEGEAVA